MDGTTATTDPHDPSSFSIQPNEKYAVARNAAARNVPVLVTIPKQDILAVPIATYRLQKEVRFMPVVRTYCLVVI